MPPTDDEINTAFNHAVELHRAGKIDDAAIIYRETLARFPDHLDANYLLGLIELGQGNFSSASVRIRKARDLFPSEPLYHHKLACALQGLNEFDEAEQAFRETIQLRPSDPGPKFDLACLLQSREKNLESIPLYQQVAQTLPENAGVYNNLGTALKAVNRLQEAKAALQKCVELAPGYPSGHANLGLTLHALGELDAAITAEQKALELEPNSAVFHYNFANLLRDIWSYDQAIAHYERAIALDPTMIAALNNLGNLHKPFGRLKEAEELFLKILAIDPFHATVYNNLGSVHVAHADVEKGLAMYEKAVELDPAMADALSNYLYGMQYPANIDEEDIFRKHQEWGIRFSPPLKKACDLHPADATDHRLRIGYVSGDFRRHSVAYFLEPLLQHHDKRRFEIFCYSNVLKEDEVTNRIKGHVDHWRPIFNLTDEQALAAIRNDHIDILVDLSGHTDRNRLMLFAHKPAPFQVAWLGYPNTTGLTTIDYRFTDAVADPEGMSDQLHTEKLYRLPRGFLCYRGFEDAPMASAPPCIRNGHLTFGSFNNLTKTNEQVIDNFVAVMHANPDSRLIMKSNQLADEQARTKYMAWFAARGITEDRVTLLERIPDLAGHLALYNEIDIALDTAPYNGTTTTCEALWMGVPVVALDGDCHRARVSKSILMHGNCDEFLAGDIAGLVEIIGNYSSDESKMTQTRLGLRNRLQSSPLCDEKGFTLAVEDAFTHIYNDASK